MKVAILGAGFAGLTAANELIKQGHEVHIFEKSEQSGGAAGGFKRPGWDWYVDYAYHHWFTSDHAILNLCKEIGFTKNMVLHPITATAYPIDAETINQDTNTEQLFEEFIGTNVRSYKLDSPIDLLKFDRISPVDRLRTGIMLALLKFGPALDTYHTTAAYTFLKQWMGTRSWEVLWEPLFKHKFDKYQKDINTMFFWARTKRTAALAYPEGGYQELANHFSGLLQQHGVKFHYKSEILELRKSSDTKPRFILKGSELLRFGTSMTFDAVVSTLPSPVLLKIEKDVLPEMYHKQLTKIQYLGAQTVIYETKKPVLPHTYWLSIALPQSPWMVAVQHTNFVHPRYFNNHHILYMATYTNKPLSENIWKKECPDILWQRSVFIPYAQPLYTTEYYKYMPQTTTPVPGLYIANMERTYPYDRGTNHAVRVGKQAAEAVEKNSAEERT
ncbi:MAG: FAD-dependent oxidoreductase [Candidatus Roizmanbacteria bacterium]|nr:FAD-dependent oxidoreductase [Candidatus Roizmanbacteria bacterium]